LVNLLQSRKSERSDGSSLLALWFLLHEATTSLLLPCEWDAAVLQGHTYTVGHFPFGQKFRKFQNRDKWHGNSLGRFPENPEIVEF